MMKARPGKEVVVKVRNEIGVLAALSKLIADKGINILAASAWTDGENGVVHLGSLRRGHIPTFNN